MFGCSIVSYSVPENEMVTSDTSRPTPKPEGYGINGTSTRNFGSRLFVEISMDKSHPEQFLLTSPESSPTCVYGLMMVPLPPPPTPVNIIASSTRLFNWSNCPCNHRSKIG